MHFIANVIAAAGLLASPVLAAPTTASSNPCGSIAASYRGGTRWVDAKLALDCLQSVPFDKNAAAEFINAYNSTIFQLHSTTAYLKDPPKSYQQPSTDLAGGLATILSKVNNGGYTNEYDFEADVQNLMQTSHDGHLGLKTGALSVFLFVPPMKLTSLSDDGQKTPLVYPYDDVVSAMKQNKDFSGSALTQINGMNTTAYLENWASKWQTSFTEPHADWNGLMTNPANLLAGSAPGWNGTFVFTDQFMNITYANGSTSSLKWWAKISSAAGSGLSGVTDGQSFYQAFVSSSNASSSSSSFGSDKQALNSIASNAISDATTKTTGGSNSGLSQWPLDAYPSPSLAQPGLSLPATGGQSYLTGYMVGDLAVLSMPAFEDSGSDASVFSSTIANFISMAQQNKAKNILFDVQGNNGGDPLLAYEVYKQFFPGANPFSGARIRSSTFGNALGAAFSDASTEPTENDLNTLLKTPNIGALPWIAQYYNDATNSSHQWQSWEDLVPPVADKGDAFSRPFVQVFNRSLFDQALSGSGGANGIVLDGFGNRSTAMQQPFPAENMAILANGMCTSTCTLFVELMHHQAGVKMVAAGGRTAPGPMQAATGSRGAQSYTLPQIINNVQVAARLRPDLASGPDAKLPVDTLTDYAGIQFSSASVNLWDQIRLDQSTRDVASIPLQFTYQAADCRIYYTRDTFNNYTALWQYAADAVLSDSSKCVPGSTGQPSAGTNVTQQDAGPAAFSAPGQFNTESGSGSGSTAGSGSSGSSSGSSGSSTSGGAGGAESSATPSGQKKSGAPALKVQLGASLVLPVLAAFAVLA